MFFDYHVHTNFSSDSIMDMNECIKSAIEKNVKAMCFTDHIDIDYPGQDVFGLDYNGYRKSVKYYAEKYSKKIDINLGVEVGLQSHITNQNNEFLKEKDFDFIIGSIHGVNKKELYGGDFYRNKKKFEAYNEYFTYLYDCIRSFTNFDVLGHLDIVKRYSPYEDNNIFYKDYKDIIDIILKEIIYSGKGIEVNTSGMRYSLNSYHPGIELLKVYRELGGEIITTGSDSHAPAHLAYDFSNLYKLLRECGFKYVTIFKKRKPSQIKI